jgi:hypothetical protein
VRFVLTVGLATLSGWSSPCSNLFGTAQETPNPSYGVSRQFESGTSFRQNVCHRQEQFHNKTMELEDALQGLDIRAVVKESEFFRLDPATGGIDSNNPGLVAVIMDEIARRGSFTWRDSFASFGDRIDDKDKTWTDFLLWTTETWDVSVNWWSRSSSRVGLGVTFPEGWYDASIIMVAKVNSGNEGEEKDQFNLWSFAAPFSKGTWLLIVLTLFFSGLIYWLLENIDKESDDQRLESSWLQSVWLSGIAFTTHFEFKPHTSAARIFTLSLSFWAMLVGAAYTANLASFLVVRNVPGLQIHSVEDAVKQGVKICTFRSATSEEELLRQFPHARVVRKETEAETFFGVQKGECDVALTTVGSWDTWERKAEVNQQCNLHWIGRPFKAISAGFATFSDSGTLCTSLITDVLNLHLLRMKEEGFIKEAWEEHLLREETVICDSSTSSTSPNDNLDHRSLNVQNMGGIFCFHGIMSLIAILTALVWKLTGWDKIPRFSKDGPNSREGVRVKIEQYMATAKLSSKKLTNEQRRILNAARRKSLVERFETKSTKRDSNVEVPAIFDLALQESHKFDSDMGPTQATKLSCEDNQDSGHETNDEISDIFSDNFLHSFAQVSNGGVNEPKEQFDANGFDRHEIAQLSRRQEQQANAIEKMNTQLSEILDLLKQQRSG